MWTQCCEEKRAKGEKYSISYERAELKDVARDTKHMPRNFINKNGNGITPGYVKYALPLLGELPKLGRLLQQAEAWHPVNNQNYCRDNAGGKDKPKQKRS